jgi:hypothetical protein
VCPVNFDNFPFRFAAVTITGDGVHFNMKGHTITRDDGLGRSLQQGIAVRSANAHIHNGSIVDINCPSSSGPGCAAIRLFDAPGAKINGMSLNNNTVGIISFANGNADGAGIHGNDITGNLRLGIGLFGAAAGAQITGNDLSDTGGFGSQGHGYRGNSDDVSLIGNVANSNAGVGIFLFGNLPSFPPALRNTIRDNTTLDNGSAGISLAGPTEALRPRDNLIQSNTSFGNGIQDLSEVITGGAPPFPPAADCLNTWMDNDFDFAAPDCIE